MKKFAFTTIFSMLLLVACSKQEDKPQQSAEVKTDVQDTLISIEKLKKQAGTYSETDPAIHLNILEAFAVAKSLYPDMPEQHLATEHMFQMTTSSNGKITPFHKFEDWESIKAFYGESDQNLRHITIEVYDKTSYKKSKQKAFDTCKNIWKNIDERVPNEIDELADRLRVYEQENSSAMTNRIRYGYMFLLDASHYQDGYPVVCTIGYDKT